MDGKPLSENWKDYDSWDAIGGVSGRSLGAGIVAIHSPSGWWRLWQIDGQYWHFARQRGRRLRMYGYYNVLDALRSGNRDAPKFKNFAAFAADFNGGAR